MRDDRVTRYTVLIAAVAALLFAIGCHKEVGYCADGQLDRGEQCDDGNALSGDGCSATCRREIAAGGAHTCIVRDGDRVQCWGLGANGQLGQVSRATMGDDEPGLIRGIYLGGKVKELTAGRVHHTCALLETGAVRCWGDGSRGRLGYGNTDAVGDDEHPAAAGDVDIGDDIVQLAAGVSHTCALLAEGTVRCWGKGTVGRLGYGNTNNIGDDELPSSAGNVDVGGKVKKLAAGDTHTCALLETGNVRCWGLGENGRLGYGNTENIGDNETPSSAGDVPVGGKVKELAAGDTHTCAVMEKDGAVRCWGFNGQGCCLGYPGEEEDIGDDELPSSVGDVDVGGAVEKLVAGFVYTCALMETGAMRCWGSNSNGKLGYGGASGSIGDDEHPSSAGDIDVGGTVIGMSAAESHTCALMETGDVRCWGDGANGALG